MAANKSSLQRQMTGFIVPPLDAGLIHDMACKVDLLSDKEEPKRHYRQSWRPRPTKGGVCEIEKDLFDYLSKDICWLGVTLCTTKNLLCIIDRKWSIYFWVCH